MFIIKRCVVLSESKYINNIFLTKKQDISNIGFSIDNLFLNTSNLYKQMTNEYKTGNIESAENIYNKLLDEQKKLLFLEPELYDLEFAILLIIGVEYFNKDKKFLEDAKNILSSNKELNINFLEDKILELEKGI